MKAQLKLLFQTISLKSQCTIPPENGALRPIEMQCVLNEGSTIADFKAGVFEKGIDIPYRLVYRPVGEEKLFYAVERNVYISENLVEII